MNYNNDHQDVLAAIANAAELCGKEPEPQPLAQQAPPQPSQQAAPPFQQAPVPVAAQPAQAFIPQPAPQQSAPHPQVQQVVNFPTGAKKPDGLQPIPGEGPTDEEMREVFAERKKKKFKLGLAINLTLLALLVAPCLGFTAWYHSSPANKESFAALMQNFKEVPDDVKSMATIKESYDEALEEIGARGDSINAATLALGVDPAEFENGAAEDDDTKFLEEQAQRTALND